jgi:hypothetical protein
MNAELALFVDGQQDCNSSTNDDMEDMCRILLTLAGLPYFVDAKDMFYEYLTMRHKLDTCYGVPAPEQASRCTSPSTLILSKKDREDHFSIPIVLSPASSRSPYFSR